MITLTLLMILFCGGIFYVGFGIAWLLALIVFKTLWLGLHLIFSLGKGVILGIVLAVFLIVKLSGVLLMLAGVGACLFFLWLLFQIFGGSRQPAPSYGSYAKNYGGGSRHEATMYRLNATLSRLERRMADLEDEMLRRGGR